MEPASWTKEETGDVVNNANTNPIDVGLERAIQKCKELDPVVPQHFNDAYDSFLRMLPEIGGKPVVMACTLRLVMKRLKEKHEKALVAFAIAGSENLHNLKRIAKEVSNKTKVPYSK